MFNEIELPSGAFLRPYDLIPYPNPKCLSLEALKREQQKLKKEFKIIKEISYKKGEEINHLALGT